MRITQTKNIIIVIFSHETTFWLSECKVNLLSIGFRLINAFVYQFDADLASAANYAICLMMRLVVNKGKYQVKHLKCKCWSVKHLPLPFWYIVIRLVLIFRRFFPAVLGFHPALTRRPPVLSKKRHCQDAKTSDNVRNLLVLHLRSCWSDFVACWLLYYIMLCARSDDKSAQLYLYCQEENPEMFLVPPPLDRVLQHVALFIIFLDIAKPHWKHNHM